MVPFESGGWVVVVSAGGICFLGKQRNTQENWIYLESVWRLNSLMTRDLEKILQGGVKMGVHLKRDVWLETTGAEVYPLSEKPDWID